MRFCKVKWIYLIQQIESVSSKIMHLGIKININHSRCRYLALNLVHSSSLDKRHVVGKRDSVG